MRTLEELARHAKALIEACEADGVTVTDGTVVDLIADNTGDATLADIRRGLVIAGYAERFPRATSRNSDQASLKTRSAPTSAHTPETRARLRHEIDRMLGRAEGLVQYSPSIEHVAFLQAQLDATTLGLAEAVELAIGQRALLQETAP